MGRMGRETLAALLRDPDLDPVGAIDIAPREGPFPLSDGSTTIPYATTLDQLLAHCQADVVIDFTNAAACMSMAPFAAASGLHLVIGTTGLTDAHRQTLADLSKSHNVGIIAVPNFALGAVVLSYLARVAAKFFDYADIFEAHHENKIDAPSGTALDLAKVITTEKSFNHVEPDVESLASTRGGQYNGVSIHSTRMPGRMAHHEVVFGITGQTLSLRHDTLSRECYMPALMLAVKEAVKRKELVLGLEDILGLS